MADETKRRIERQQPTGDLPESLDSQLSTFSCNPRNRGHFVACVQELSQYAKQVQ